MAKNKSINIKDVAAYAHVGISTVSRVLNGTKKVSSDKEKRVLDAVDALNYEVNKLAKGLKSGKTNLICVIVPSIQSIFFPILLHNIHIAAQKHGYSVSIFETERDVEVEKKYIQLLKSQLIDGILLSSSADTDDPLSKEYINSLSSLSFNGKSIPVILLEAEVSNQLDCVVVNDQKAIFDATHYLLSIGRKNIAYIGGPHIFEVAKNRKIGYISAMRYTGIPILNHYMIEGDYTARSGFECMQKLIDSGIALDGLVAANDQMAIGAIHCATEKGLKIPEEVSIIGIDNNVVSSLLSPSLTTMNVPKEKMGEYAFELLLKRLNNPELKRQKVVLDANLIKRQTTERNISTEWDLTDF
jgi:LacI family transcriptional regulator